MALAILHRVETAKCKMRQGWGVFWDQDVHIRTKDEPTGWKIDDAVEESMLVIFVRHWTITLHSKMRWVPWVSVRVCCTGESLLVVIWQFERSPAYRGPLNEHQCSHAPAHLHTSFYRTSLIRVYEPSWAIYSFIEWQKTIIRVLFLAWIFFTCALAALSVSLKRLWLRWWVEKTNIHLLHASGPHRCQKTTRIYSISVISATRVLQLCLAPNLLIEFKETVTSQQARHLQGPMSSILKDHGRLRSSMWAPSTSKNQIEDQL
jgi:hypothetical protein